MTPDQCLERREFARQHKGLAGAFDALQSLQLCRQQAVHQAERRVAGRQAHGLEAIGEQDVVDPGAPLDGAGLAPGDRRPGEGLQFQRDVLDDMAQPRAFFEAPDQSSRALVAAAVAAQARQQGQQPLGETGQPVGGPSLQPAEVYLQPDHRQCAEQMRAAIDGFLQEPQGLRANPRSHRSRRNELVRCVYLHCTFHRCVPEKSRR